MLAMWTSPVWVVGVIHYVSHGALDVFGPKAESAALASIWAGVQAWLVIGAQLYNLERAARKQAG